MRGEWTAEGLAESYRRIGFKTVEIAKQAPSTAEVWIEVDAAASADRPATAIVRRRFGGSWVELGEVQLSPADGTANDASTAAYRDDLFTPGRAHQQNSSVGQVQIGSAARKGANKR